MKTNVPSILEVLCTSIFGDNSSLITYPPHKTPPPGCTLGALRPTHRLFSWIHLKLWSSRRVSESCNHPIIPRKRKSTEVSCFLISPSHTLYCLFCGWNRATVPSAWVEDETNKELRWRFLQAPTCVFNLNFPSISSAIHPWCFPSLNIPPRFPTDLPWPKNMNSWGFIWPRRFIGHNPVTPLGLDGKLGRWRTQTPKSWN